MPAAQFEFEFDRSLFILFTALYGMVLSLPAFLHTRGWVSISTLAWIIMCSFQTVAIFICKWSVGARFHTKFKSNAVYNLFFHILIMALLFGYGNYSFLPLINFSVLAYESGNITQSLSVDTGTGSGYLTSQQNTLNNTLYAQITASILASLLFMLELCAEHFGHLGTYPHIKQQQRERRKRKLKYIDTRSRSTTSTTKSSPANFPLKFINQTLGLLQPVDEETETSSSTEEEEERNDR